MSELKVNSVVDAAGGNTVTVNDYWNLFDYKDGQLFWKNKQSNVKAGSVAGSKTAEGYLTVSIKKKRLLAHRIIYFMFHGKEPNFVDHINGVKTDNRIENLREATLFTNAWNRPSNKNSKTGVKNVCFDKQSKKWIVQLTANRKKLVHKIIEDFELAELVAMEARNKFHGNFAYSGA